jgi:succinyl-diaminopimelate desuccinylase
MDVLDLTRRLVAFDTVNPPGDERDCALFLAGLLAEAGLSVRTYEFDDRRTSLVATLPGGDTRAPLVLTGHIDVVPLGAAAWSFDPFVAETGDGRVYGRGTCDMKGAVAAMVIAAQRLAREHRRCAPLQLVFTAGEERGCLGAQHLTEQPGALAGAGAMLVGEPTGNRPCIAHKGILRVAVSTAGITAHASMPELGDNAIFKAAEAALALRTFEFGVEPHPLLGRPTLNVGTIQGGLNINSVPDAATLGLDIRTVAAQDENDVLVRLRRHLGDDVAIARMEGAGAIASDPADPWVQSVLDILADIQGRRPQPQSAPYFTDAAYLKPALGEPPTLILGPGEAEVAHKTDEYCAIVKLEEAVEIYTRVAQAWCGA